MGKTMTREEKAEAVRFAIARLPDAMNNSELFATVMTLLLSYNMTPEAVKMTAALMVELVDSGQYPGSSDGSGERVH
jgi:hypothetical protein